MLTIFPSFSSRCAVELIAALKASHSVGELGVSMLFDVRFAQLESFFSSMESLVMILHTDILFCVIVPVLSEQITVADPMVSHATNCLTRDFALVIFRMARANEIVTLMGNPSGTATTMMMTM